MQKKVLGAIAISLIGLVFLSGCEIPFIGGEEPECTLVPCQASQELEEELDDIELLPESIVGENTADLRVLDKCQVDENHFTDCFIEVPSQLVTFKTNYAGIIPVDINASIEYELSCYPSTQGLEKADFVDQHETDNELANNCFEKAPVDWCCDFVGPA